MEIKITKRTVLAEWSNSTCDGCETLIQGRIYNDSGDYFRRFKFVIYFCCDDIYNYFRNSEHYNESVTEEQNEIYFDKHYKQIKNDYINLNICGFTDYINNYYDCNYFYELCNESINEYNKRHSYFLDLAPTI